MNNEELRKLIDILLVNAKEGSGRMWIMENDGTHLMPDILNELVALYQEPVELDRDALDTIIASSNLDSTLEDVSGIKIMSKKTGKEISIQERLADYIMAWASGKKDCDHQGWYWWETEYETNKDIPNALDLSTLPGGCPKCSVKS